MSTMTSTTANFLGTLCLTTPQLPLIEDYKGYRSKIEEELEKLCRQLLDILDDCLLPRRLCMFSNA
jgi:hypothetical protein